VRHRPKCDRSGCDRSGCGWRYGLFGASWSERRDSRTGLPRALGSNGLDVRIHGSLAYGVAASGSPDPQNPQNLPMNVPLGAPPSGCQTRCLRALIVPHALRAARPIHCSPTDRNSHRAGWRLRNDVRPSRPASPESGKLDPVFEACYIRKYRGRGQSCGAPRASSPEAWIFSFDSINRGRGAAQHLSRLIATGPRIKRLYDRGKAVRQASYASPRSVCGGSSGRILYTGGEIADVCRGCLVRGERVGSRGPRRGRHGDPKRDLDLA